MMCWKCYFYWKYKLFFFQVIHFQIIYFSIYNVKQKHIYFSNCYTFAFINKYKDKQASQECALRMQIEFIFIAYLILNWPEKQIKT